MRRGLHVKPAVAGSSPALLLAGGSSVGRARVQKRLPQSCCLDFYGVRSSTVERLAVDRVTGVQLSSIAPRAHRPMVRTRA